MSRVFTSLLAATATVLVVACTTPPADTPYASFEILDEGTGEPNAQPLEPLVTGTRIGLRTVVGPRENGLIEVVETPPADNALANRFSAKQRRWYRRAPSGVERVGIPGERLAEGDGGKQAAVLLVPKTVRLGLRWQSGAHWGVDKPYTFRVTKREEHTLPLGKTVVWTIETEEPYYLDLKMIYAEGLGRLRDDFDVNPAALALESLLVPEIEPPTPTPGVEVVSETVPLPETARQSALNLEALAVTVLDRGDEGLSIAVRGQETLLNGLVPENEPLHFCLGYLQGAVTGAAPQLLTVAHSYPFAEVDNRPPSDGTRCLGLTDMSAVMRRPSTNALLALTRQGNGVTSASRARSGDHYLPAMLLRQGLEDPVVLVAVGDGFLLHPYSLGTTSGASPDFALGPPTLARWGLLAAYDLPLHGGLFRRDGTYFAPDAVDVRSSEQVLYHLTPNGLLVRSLVDRGRLAPVEPIFATLDAPTLTTYDATSRVLTTTTDGTVRRLVLERGSERLETLGRVKLGPAERLAGAVQARDGSETLLFISDHGGEVQYGGSTCPGCVRIPFRVPSFRLRRATFAQPSPYTPPPIFAVSARNVGADALVCWAPTTTTLDTTDWTLGGKPSQVIALTDSPCALVLRNPSTTAAELAGVDAYALTAKVPDVGVVRVAAVARDAAELTGPATMLGDRAIGRLGQLWHVAGLGFGGSYEDLNAASLFDDVSGVWLRGPFGDLAFADTSLKEVSVADFFSPSNPVYDLDGKVLGGGVVVTERDASQPPSAGTQYLVTGSGRKTPVGSPPVVDRTAWLPDGRSCKVGPSIQCYSGVSTVADMVISVAGVDFTHSGLWSFGTGALAIGSGKAYRLDLTSGTATALTSTTQGLLGTALSRGANGTFWTLVSKGPGETEPAGWRVARIDANGARVFELAKPDFVDAAAQPDFVYPGELFLSLSVGGRSVKYALPSDP